MNTLFFSQKILDKNMHFVVYVIMLKEILMRDVNLPKKIIFFKQKTVLVKTFENPGQWHIYIISIYYCIIKVTIKPKL